MSQIKKPRRRTQNESVPLISKILLELRLESRMTQENAARAIGISAITLSRLEKGDLRINVRNLEKILNFFDLTIGAFPTGATVEHFRLLEGVVEKEKSREQKA